MLASMQEQPLSLIECRISYLNTSNRVYCILEEMQFCVGLYAYIGHFVKCNYFVSMFNEHQRDSNEYTRIAVVA